MDRLYRAVPQIEVLLVRLAERGFNLGSATSPEKSVLGKAFLAKKTGKACPCWLYVICQQKYNQPSGDLSGEEDKQQSEQAQH